LIRLAWCPARRVNSCSIVSGIESVNDNARILLEQSRCESTVAIANDERGLLAFHRGDEFASALRKDGAEGKPLRPAVDVGEMIEVCRR